MQPTPVRTEVVVTDLRMPFMSMVLFMVKWAIAAIPALIILALCGMILVSVLAGIWRGMNTSPDLRSSPPVYTPQQPEVYPPRGK